MNNSAAALVLMFVGLIATAAGVIASGRETAPQRAAIAAAPAAAHVEAANDWALIGVPPASFQITITGHPHGPLNGSATLTRSNPAALTYGGAINGIGCLIYIEPSQNFLHFNAVLVSVANYPNVTINDSFRFIAASGSSPPQTGTFPLQGGGQITIQ